MYILLRNSLPCIPEVLMLPLLSIRKDKKAMVSILDISLYLYSLLAKEVQSNLCIAILMTTYCLLEISVVRTCCVAIATCESNPRQFEPVNPS